MVIRELNRTECLDLLAGTRLARLACAKDDQPYIVPVYLVYSKAAECLYGFTTFGQKIEWMRTNPQVCVEVDEITASDQWISVVVMGRFQELVQSVESELTSHAAQQRPRQINESLPSWSEETHQSDTELPEDVRDQAFQLLNSQPGWWEPGWAVWASRVDEDPTKSYKPIYYRISIDHVTGHQASRDLVAT